jgi:hypothetical protein
MPFSRRQFLSVLMGTTGLLLACSTAEVGKPATQSVDETCNAEDVRRVAGRHLQGKTWHVVVEEAAHAGNIDTSALPSRSSYPILGAPAAKIFRLSEASVSKKEMVWRLRPPVNQMGLWPMYSHQSDPPRVLPNGPLLVRVEAKATVAYAVVLDVSMLCKSAQARLEPYSLP